MLTFRTEFPDFDPATMPAIPAGWVDQSWHNDACPSFDTGTGMLVSVDYAERADREIEEGERFVVMAADCDVLLATDDWAVVLAFVARGPNFAAMDAKALNDWYYNLVGYRPQDDDPTMTIESLRDLCASRLAAEG